MNKIEIDLIMVGLEREVGVVGSYLIYLIMLKWSEVGRLEGRDEEKIRGFMEHWKLSVVSVIWLELLNVDTVLFLGP